MAPTEQEEEDSQDSEKQNGSTRSLDRRPDEKGLQGSHKGCRQHSWCTTPPTRSLTSLEEHKACLI